MGIYAKLETIRRAIREMDIEKTGWNPHTKHKYFELTDFLPQAMELFHEQGVFPRVSFSADMATLTLIDMEDSGSCEVFTSPILFGEAKGISAIQVVGAVHTYMRRYLYILALELLESCEVEMNEPEPEERKPRSSKAKPEAAKKQYPAADFEFNYPTWEDAIKNGETTAERMIQTIETRFTLTNEQKAEIRKIKRSRK